MEIWDSQEASTAMDWYKLEMVLREMGLKFKIKQLTNMLHIGHREHHYPENL